MRPHRSWPVLIGYLCLLWVLPAWEFVTSPDPHALRSAQWFDLASCGGGELQTCVTAIGSVTPTTLGITDVRTVTVNATVTSNITLLVLGAGQLSINSVVTVTIHGKVLVGEIAWLAGAGAVNTVFGSTSGVSAIHVRWLGAVGDGTTDDSTAIQNSITIAQASTNANVYLGSGVFAIGTGLVISGSNKGIAIVGVPGSSQQQGSTNQNCVIKWTGGASALVTVSNTFTSFWGCALQNFGTGTYAINFSAQAGRAEFRRLSFVVPSGATAWSTASIGFQNGVDYSYADRVEWGASTAIYLRGNSTDFHDTWSVYDGAAAGHTAAWWNVDANVNRITIEHATINYYSPNNLIFWDNSGTTGTISLLRILDTEFAGAGVAGQYIAKAKNITQIDFGDNYLDSFGNVTAAPIQLTNSTLSVHGLTGNSNAKALAATTDSASYIIPERNGLTAMNTHGIIDVGSQSGLLSDQTSVNLNGALLPANSVGTFRINFAANSVANIFILTPTSNPAGMMEIGQLFWVVIKNTSGGNLTNITWDSAFALAGTVTYPATGKQRGWLFQWDGTTAHELSRTDADVAN